MYAHVHGQPHSSQIGTLSTHMNIGSTNGLILLPSLFEQDGI